MHDELTRLVDLLVRLGVGWHGERRVLGFKSVLSLDESSGHKTLEVALHGDCGVVGFLIRVVVDALSASTLRLLSIQLRLIGLRTATSLSHFF